VRLGAEVRPGWIWLCRGLELVDNPPYQPRRSQVVASRRLGESCYSFTACLTGTIRNLLQNPVMDWRPGKVSAMAMQSKGSRRMYATRIPVEVGDLIERRALEAGCTSTSQYLADLLAVVHGRPDLVRELNQEVMPLTA